jgi:hypothetical protein
MPRYCTECGGKLDWDRKLRQYCCVSCGISFTEAELSEARDRLHSYEENDSEKKQRRNRDYLDWWFQDKSKKRRPEL